MDVYTLLPASVAWLANALVMLSSTAEDEEIEVRISVGVLAGLATQNLNLEKACQVNLNYGEHICSELTARHTANYTTEETRVQELVAWMTVWKMALSSSFPAVIILFLGSWSDRHARRKPCLLIPIIGEFLTSLGLIVCTYFFMELPMEAAGVVEALFPALTGGWATMFVGVFSYVADVTTDEMRTFRMGVVNVFVSLGMPFGIALSGILFQKIGFYGMFSLSSVLYVMGFTYGVLSVKETRPPIPRPEGVGFLKDFFDIRHVKDTLQVAFKQRKGNRRMRVIMIMILSIVLVGPMFGESAINYLFTRYKFNWNEVDYSMYATYTVIVHLIGTMIAITLFSRVLKWDDGLIGFIGCVSKITASFVYAFSSAPWMLFVGQVVEMLAGAGGITMRSMASKLVPSDELGKMNSLFGICEIAAPLVYSPMYSLVYASTLKTLPGAVYLLGAALLVPAAAMFMTMYLLQKQDTLNNTVQMNEVRPNNIQSNNELESKSRTNQAFESDEGDVCSILGMKDTPYESGVFRLEIVIPDRYPFEPPHVRFVTPIYHPNVDESGRICLDMLKLPPKGTWRPVFSLAGLLTSIQLLQATPNPDDPLMADILPTITTLPIQFTAVTRRTTLPIRFTAVTRRTTLPIRFTAVTRRTTLPIWFTAVTRQTTLPIRFTAVTHRTTQPIRFTAVTRRPTLPIRFTTVIRRTTLPARFTAVTRRTCSPAPSTPPSPPWILPPMGPNKGYTSRSGKKEQAHRQKEENLRAAHPGYSTVASHPSAGSSSTPERSAAPTSLTSPHLKESIPP
uniref:UBC core domain-containing protein n=1 Tax=Timema shepardi TaxID=629360 RepID=A0A7R9AT70_TIMSH|nr:unnamed protein product [Timema shepardi]